MIPELDDVADARLRGCRDEIRLNLEHLRVRRGDQHRAIDAAAAQHLGLRKPPWHRADRRLSVPVAPKARGG